MTTKIDMEKLCPELANEVRIREDVIEATKKSIFGADENTLEALQNDLDRINAIETRFFVLADMIEEAKRIMQDDSITENDRIEEWAEWLDKYNKLLANPHRRRR